MPRAWARSYSCFLPERCRSYILHKYYLRRRFLRALYVARISPQELKQKLDLGEEVTILDVRHALDFEADPYIVPGALRIPAEDLEGYGEFPKEREVVVYCS